MEPDGVSSVATGSFSAAEMQSVAGGMQYWTERLQYAGDAKIILNLAKLYQDSGTAYSWDPATGRNNSDLYEYVVHETYNAPGDLYGYHTEIIFQSDYTTTPTRLLLDDNSIMSTITHELMHALGLAGLNRYSSDVWSFAHGVDAWNSNLYDLFGTRAVLDGSVVIQRADASTTAANPSVFYLPQTGADVMDTLSGTQKTFFPTFHGSTVDALTQGRGLPVMAGNGSDYHIDGENVLGHPALLGSIMSYAPLRNMLFTELELAALKDLGYDIDLKKSFGKSYYPSQLGGVLTQDTTMGVGRTGGYLAETPLTVSNSAGFDSDYSYGLGLHVYRDLLNVTQLADIHARGYGGGGIRVDGVGNTVTIPAGVAVTASGENGTGLLVSYGKNNVVNLLGTVQATGAGGIGAHFGIGVGTTWGNSHFYSDVASMQNSDDKYFFTKMNADLNGPLVKDFFVAGTLVGSNAAIQVDWDAQVKNINILSGAHIQGDINVAWNPFYWETVLGETSSLVSSNADLATYGSTLNVGVDASGTADRSFAMRYTGTIDGRAHGWNNTVADNKSALALAIRGGIFSFNGTGYFWKGDVDAGATLKGNSTLHFTDADGNPGMFSNVGTIAPGNKIGNMTIDGNFTNTGTLLMEFNAQEQADHLSVSGTFSNPSGTVQVTPLRDFYANVVKVPSVSSMFTGGAGSSIPNSGTFVAPEGVLGPYMVYDGAANLLYVQRPTGLYASYGVTGNARRVGSALDGIVNVAKGDMAELIGVLDFSASDGSDVRAGLPQLTPAPYGYSAQASAEDNLVLGRMAIDHTRSLAETQRSSTLSADDASRPQWFAFVLPFTNSATQQKNGGIHGYSNSQNGFMVGFLRQNHALTLGVYTALANRQVDTRTSGGAQIRSLALNVGVVGIWQPESTGWHAFAQMQLGMENIDSKRTVTIVDYYRQNQSSSTAFSGTAMLGGGWQWQLDSWKLGPFMGLEYAFNILPSTQEWDGEATRLNVDSYVRHDLRGVAGINVEWRKNLDEERAVRARMTAAWRQELTSPKKTIHAKFVGYDSYGFDTIMERDGRGSLGITASLHWDMHKDVTLRAHVNTEVLRPNYSTLGGGLSVRWKF